MTMILLGAIGKVLLGMSFQDLAIRVGPLDVTTVTLSQAM